ncbi:MAG: hypothetical protein ACRC46_01270 [Thermoguttaceae bacterium]
MFSAIKETIVNMWNAVTKFFADLFKFLWDTVIKVLQWIVDWYSYIAETLYKWFWEFFWWCEGCVMDVMEWTVNQLPSLNDVLGPYYPHAKAAFDYMGKMNEFVPIVEALGIFAVWLAVFVLYLYIRFVIRVAPFVG